MPFLDISPASSEGLHFERPPYLRKWGELKNVVFRRGFLRSRPGWAEMEPEHPTAVEAGVPAAIMEFRNPGSNANSRDPDNTRVLLETLRGTADNVTFNMVSTGAFFFTEVDDSPPDNFVTLIRRSPGTSSAQARFDKPALTTAFDLIDTVVIRGRVRWSAGNTTARTVFTPVLGSDDADNVNFPIVVFDGKEAGTGFDFASHLSVNPLTSAAWTVADIDPEPFGIKFDDSVGGSGNAGFTTSEAAVDLRPGANGFYTSWSGVFSDIDDPIETPGVDKITSGTVGQRESWTLTPAVPFAKITKVTVKFVAATVGAGTATIRSFIRRAGVDTPITNNTVSSSTLTTFTTVIPADELSTDWLPSDINTPIEFGVHYEAAVGGTPTLEVYAWEMEIEGVTSTVELEFDWLALDVYGRKFGNSGAESQNLIGTSRLYLTTRSFLRLDDETSGSGFTNVQGAVTVPTAFPYDWAVLYGQAYFVNGRNQTWFYPTAGNVFGQLAGKPTGRTIAAFGGRIMLGWVTEGANITPERVQWSDLNDGQVYIGASSGFFDTLASPGGVVKLLPLSESLCGLYKQVGIWNTRLTGDDSVPFIPDLIDGETGCLSSATVKATISPNGTPIHYFLGWNPKVGTSVFSFDGSQVVEVGQKISPRLQDNMRHSHVTYAHAAIDPEAGLYWLFVPEGTEVYPRKAWVMDLSTGEWSEETSTHAYSAAGQWSLVTAKSPQGKLTLIGGRFDDAHVYKLGYSTAVDAAQLDAGSSETFATKFVTPSIVVETGDLRYTEPQLHTLAYRVHVTFVDRGSFTCAVAVSTDGGITFNTALTETLGGGAAGRYLTEILDVTAAHEKRIRFRFTFTPANDAAFIELAEVVLETQTGGEAA